MKHEVVVLAAAWQSRRARGIEVGLSASSPEVSNDDEGDTTMEMCSDDTALAPAPPVHSGYTMAHAQTHYNAALAEGQRATMSTSVLERALEQHRLALGQSNDERSS
ncbi:CASP-like protein [Hordeum vulgare]|nr:CASP-like protein [Hordeum vulgare]